LTARGEGAMGLLVSASLEIAGSDDAGRFIRFIEMRNVSLLATEAFSHPVSVHWKSFFMIFDGTVNLFANSVALFCSWRLRSANFAGLQLDAGST